MDYDRQSSSMDWLASRSSARPPIEGIAAYKKSAKRPGRNTDFVIHDAPAGKHGGELSKMLNKAQTIIIPVLPSPIDYCIRFYLSRHLGHEHQHFLGQY